MHITWHITEIQVQSFIPEGIHLILYVINFSLKYSLTGRSCASSHAWEPLSPEKAEQSDTYPTFNPAIMHSMLISPERSTLLSIVAAHLARRIQTEWSENIIFLLRPGRSRCFLYNSLPV